jgi:predicted ATPase/class 3 adenylate cyclase/transcriptional regulator with XRE-family HTH domain
METQESIPSQQVQEPFGALLRRYRLAAGLSQEDLAEQAGLSVQGLSALENGRRQAPYRHTVTLLATALGLTAAQTAALDAAVPRGRLLAGSAPPTPAPTPESPAPENGPAIVPAPAGAAVAGPAPTPAALPAGTLTFLLTDIEGSTPLWEQHPAAMQAAIARHDALLAELLARHGGRQVKDRGEGDSILAVFTSPSAALAAACALQAALLAEPWPAHTPLRARMGLHTGEAALQGSDYYGVTVNRAARIRSLGHGEQILLSRATAELARDTLPAGTSLRALGSHALTGLAQPEEIYQVVHPGLPAEFPPLASPSAHPSNLPVALTSFIGREREQSEVRALLDAARLVTLTGAGGAGKTRLALAVAEVVLEAYPDGVWLVELAPLADPALVVQAVAQTLGPREEAGRSLRETLLAHLRERHLLLVLDNCEHLVSACAALALALLQGCPSVRIQATSREELGVPGERLYRVPSLAVPDLRRLPPPELTGTYEAVRLFVARAQERRADFALTSQNAQAVAQVCARLDGMPLAIELAAARVGSLPVTAIAARLDDRFRLLTGGPRTAVPRQQTLRGAIDWSYQLLSLQEQALFARLAVFTGGCTLVGIAAVCLSPDEAEDVLAGYDVLEGVSSLVEKSLLRLDEGMGGRGEPRFALLETMHEYARLALEARGETAWLRARHAAYVLALVEAAEPHLQGAEHDATWLAQLEAEHDNLRAVLRWAQQAEDQQEVGLRLVAGVWPLWAMHGRVSEGRSWLERFLAPAQGVAWHTAGTPAVVRAKALAGAGLFAFAQGDYAWATVLQEERLVLCRELEDRLGIAQALNAMGILAEMQGEYARATDLLEESLALLRDLDDRPTLAEALLYLGITASRQGDYARATGLLEESLALSRDLSIKRLIGHALSVLGLVALDQVNYARATVLLEESLALFGDVGYKWGIAWCLEGLAQVAAAPGAAPAALERAGRFLGTAAALRAALGVPLAPIDHESYERTVAALRASLGDAAWQVAWDEGWAQTVEQAIASALTAPRAPPPGRGGQSPHRL